MERGRKGSENQATRWTAATLQDEAGVSKHGPEVGARRPGGSLAVHTACSPAGFRFGFLGPFYISAFPSPLGPGGLSGTEMSLQHPTLVHAIEAFSQGHCQQAPLAPCAVCWRGLPMPALSRVPLGSLLLLLYLIALGPLRFLPGAVPLTLSSPSSSLTVASVSFLF